MFRVFVEMCKVLFVGVYYCVGVLCFILFAMSIGTLVVPVLVKEVETGSVELFQSGLLPAPIHGESLQINSSPAALRLLPEICKSMSSFCLSVAFTPISNSLLVDFFDSWFFIYEFSLYLH